MGGLSRGTPPFQKVPHHWLGEAAWGFFETSLSDVGGLRDGLRGGGAPLAGFEPAASLLNLFPLGVLLGEQQ